MNLENSKAIIIGLSGPELTTQEIKLIESYNPLGFILFQRNCQTPAQVKKLTTDLCRISKRENVPILIDQEGGRVARLTAPHWPLFPPAQVFGNLAHQDPAAAAWCVQANYWLIGQELKSLGITVNCAPVLDWPQDQAHPIIGDRAFSNQADLIVSLGKDCALGLMQAGIIPVFKHFPGHGRALVDSHEHLPIIHTSYQELQKTDFQPFQEICADSVFQGAWGMTAHIVYSQLDANAPATQSLTLIKNIVRTHIGFEGFLISDCLTMKALSGTFVDKAALSLKAGCDAVLHCNGEIEEMIELLPHVAPLNLDALKRLSTPLKIPNSLFQDKIQVRKELDQRLKVAQISV